jgi:anti-sigma factor RsiW
MAAHHILDDNLESYSLGRLGTAAMAPVEEHLLGCSVCRDRLARWDDYIRAMRTACRTLRDVPQARTAGGQSQE